MVQNLVDKSRKGWVDALRGLAILLVMYGHCVKGFAEFFSYTSPVKMPLFFAISGYVFSIKEWRVFFKQLALRVIVPWLILGMLPSLLAIPLHGFSSIVGRLLNMLSGKELWFFPCFIIGQVIHYLIRKYLKANVWIIVLSLACFALGLLLSRHHILNFAMINRALTVQPFFLMGFLFRLYENKLIKLKWHWIILSVIIYLVMCTISLKLWSGLSIDVHLNRYPNVPYSMVLILLGCFTLFTAASKANFSSLTMSFIGQNTLVLYIWHGIVIGLLEKGTSILGWDMPINWLTALIKVLWACVVCGAAAIFLNRYFSFAVGKRKTN